MTMNKRKYIEQQLEMVTIDMLVPENHFVRKLDDCINWYLIYDLVKDKYSDLGRKSVDPVILFKIVFWNIINGYNSIRRTCASLETDMAGRWFLGIGIFDPIPNYSDWSKNYQRRFQGTDICNQIFQHILKQMDEAGLLDLSAVYIDSTHQKANANKHKKRKIQIKVQAKKYQEALTEEINREREKHDQKPLKEVVPTELEFDEKTREEKEVSVRKTKTVTVSTTDPDCGVFNKGDHETSMAYLHHTICDNNGIVLTVKTFPANLHDSTTMAETLDTLPELAAGRVEAIALDAGYKTAAAAKELEDRGLKGFMPYKRPMGKKGLFQKKEFIYNSEQDFYICPAEHELHYSTTNRNGYKEYKSNPNICKDCPLREMCTKSKNTTKVVTRHVWQDSLDKIEARRNGVEWKQIYTRRKETIERVFAENKEHHNLRFTRQKGLEKNQDQILLIFACHNLMKLARWRTA